MNSDTVFIVMLGAAVWTSIQLSTGPSGLMQRMPLPRLSQIAVIEGLVCAVVWSSINLGMAQSLSRELVLQGVAAGCVWALFTLVARAHFRGTIPATK
ncbi:MAG: hypothetical protein M3R24_30790 [Chloroflexota bacterium]|nr:hypothetical protein [Chloroflexota bacterium]PLS77951.1 MAG: hypothetical protein CYG59_21095 [Chloroflexota bacterium]